MHITINLPSDSHSHSHTINVNEATQGVAALELAAPPPPSPSMNTVISSSDDKAWASLYPIPADLDIAAKPWLPGPHKKITLINATVVDPKSSKTFAGQTLKLVDGKIASIKGSSSTQDAFDSSLEGSTVVDCTGLFLTPGLIDCHSHITATPGSATIAGMMNDPRDAIILRSTHVLNGMLSRGFTTVRDVGGACKAHSTATEEWLIAGPRLFQGGPVMSQTGGHGDASDPNGTPGTGCCSGASGGGMGQVVDGVDECLRYARDAMRKGADHIKICTSGGVGSVTDKLEGTQFTAAELLAITTTVRQMGGRLVTAHCYTSEGIRHAISGGVGGIEHGNLLDKPTAKLMAEKGIYLTPTLAVHTIISSPPFMKFLLPSQLEKNEIVRVAGLQAIQNAEEAGVTVCYGTDMLGAMHPAQTRELVTRASVLPSPTVLKHVTCNGAELVGCPDTLGTLIKVGAFADILFMKSNPLEDVTIFDRPREELYAIMKDGRVVRSRVKGLDVEIRV